MSRFLFALVLALLAGCGGADASAVDASDSAQPPQFRVSGPEGARSAELIDRYIELDLRDAPYQLRAAVQRNNGRVDTLALPVTRVKDSTIARVVEGRVQPVDAGQTRAEIDLSDRLRLSAVISVQERIFADTVRLRPGQVHAWNLRPGWHRITVDAKAAPGEPQPLELAADLICVPDARGPRETIICRVRQDTRVLLRHTGVGRQVGPAVAVVEIVRLPR